MRRRCPHGHGRLERETLAPSRFGWRCPSCGGRGVDLKMLEGLCGADVPRSLERRAARPVRRGPSCPSCRRTTAEVETTAHGLVVAVDVCRGCRHAWFDSGELEQLPRRKDEDRGFAEDLRGMAAATSEMVLSRPPERARRPSVRVSSWTEALLWIKGLPVLLHAPRTKGSSTVTVTCLAAIAVIGGLGLLRPEDAVERLGFVPRDPWGIGLAGSFFVHASAFHLLGNAWFLWLFGRGVEEEEGGARFALLLVGAHLAALVAHAAHDPRSDLPVVGASGAISGVMTFFALRFPYARIGIRFAWVRWMNLPVLAWLGFWMLCQVYGAAWPMAGDGAASSLGHLGGALIGFTVWLAGWAVRRLRDDAGR